MPEKTYHPVSGKEGMSLSQTLADREKPFVVKSWPYSTEDVGEQAALDAHPWIEGDSEPETKPLSKMNKAELTAEAEKRGLDTTHLLTNAAIKDAIEVHDDPDQKEA